MLERIGSQSLKYVVNAYYNTALSYKYMNNEESLVMLDITYNSIAFELAQIYTSCLGVNGNYLEAMRKILASKTNTVSSKYKKLSTVITTKIEVINTDFGKLK